MTARVPRSSSKSAPTILLPPLPQVGGRWLGWMVVIAAIVSQVGQFEAEMSTDSYLLHGMAERGFLPSVFAHKSRHGTPSLGIACSALGIIGMAGCARE